MYLAAEVPLVITRGRCSPTGFAVLLLLSGFSSGNVVLIRLLIGIVNNALPDPQSQFKAPSTEWTPENLNKPLHKLDLWVFTRGHETLDTALDVFCVLLASEARGGASQPMSPCVWRATEMTDFAGAYVS